MSLNYTLIRSSRRKTIGLQVKNAEVVVRAPYFVKASFIEKFVIEKSLWLEEKIASQKKYKKLPSCILRPKVLIDGISHTINIRFAAPNIERDKALSIITINIDEKLNCHEIDSDIILTKARFQLEKWLKTETTRYINDQLPIFTDYTCLRPAAVKIRKYKARWGSCNNRKELSFNSLLKMMPHWVIDYVVVHELCHLEHMNHSASFWRLVAKHYPNYLEAKQWIRTNSRNLTLT